MPASPSPAVQNLGEMLAPVVQVQQHEQTYLISAESICPMDLLKLLIDDYFTFCHPLTPFPHEPWFRDAFAKRMDHDDRLFLALLAGMIGCLTATFPRRPRKHMRALRREDLFSSSLEFVNRCSGIVHAARGTGYLEHDGLGAYDAAVSYFLFVMHTCTYRFKAGRLYLSECVSLLRQLNLYDEEQQNQIWNPARSESSEGLVEGSVATNKVEQEMARRVFWTAFVAGRLVSSSHFESVRAKLLDRSGKTLGFSWVEPYMNPASPNAPYPPLPLKIDDRYIYEDFIEHQPQGTVSSITGFNANVSVYLTMDPLIALDSLYNTDQAHDWRKQLSILDGCLADVKQSLDNLPKELSAWLRATSHSPFMEEHGFVRREFFVSQPPQLNDQAHSITPISPQERQYITYETQKANIYASYLSVRSFFTERRGALMEAHVLSQNSTQASQQSEAQKELHAEREAIAQDLLGVLSNIRPVHIEPNSVSLFMKIRQVASPLSPVSTGENGEKLFIREDRSGEYLQRFVEMLTSLEKCGKRTPSSDGLSEDVNEEEELRRWADLAYYQKQFAQGS